MKIMDFMKTIDFDKNLQFPIKIHSFQPQNPSKSADFILQSWGLGLWSSKVFQTKDQIA